MSPPLPFPYPLRIGTDICRLARIAHILRGKQGARFIRRVLAPEELARAKPAIRQILEAASQAREGDGGHGLPDDRPMRIGKAGRGGGREGEECRTGEEAGDEEGIIYGRAATYIAGRFAAKEAAFKAHPHLRLGFHDILILSSSDAEELTGEIALAGRGSAAPVALIRAGNGDAVRDQMAQVSISHDGEYATAMCIGFEAEVEGTDMARSGRGEAGSLGFRGDGHDRSGDVEWHDNQGSAAGH